MLKALGIGMLGFVLMAAVVYGGLVAYGQVQRERAKEAILVDLACQSPATVQKFGIQCPANATPPAPTVPAK